MPGGGLIKGVAARREVLGANHMERLRRRVLDFGVLAALGRLHEFELTFCAALVNKVSLDKLKVVPVQIAIHGGRKVLAEEGSN
jgi:4-carboxymuconolactone decarboxylase